MEINKNPDPGIQEKLHNQTYYEIRIGDIYPKIIPYRISLFYLAIYSQLCNNRRYNLDLYTI